MLWHRDKHQTPRVCTLTRMTSFKRARWLWTGACEKPLVWHIFWSIPPYKVWQIFETWPLGEDRVKQDSIMVHYFFKKLHTYFSYLLLYLTMTNHQKWFALVSFSNSKTFYCHTKTFIPRDSRNLSLTGVDVIAREFIFIFHIYFTFI